MANQSIKISDLQFELKQKHHSIVSLIGRLSGFSLHKQITEYPSRSLCRQQGKKTNFYYNWPHGSTIIISLTE